MTRFFEGAPRLHAPHLLDIEVASGVRRLVQRKEITLDRAEQAFEDFSRFAIERHAHAPLLARIWELRDAMTAYDGTYVALAEALDAPLLTCDCRLARAHGHRAKIETIED